MLNTFDFGIPQNRERIYIVGFTDKKIYENYHFLKEQKHKYHLKNFVDLDSKNIPEKYFYKNNKYFEMLKVNYQQQ